MTIGVDQLADQTPGPAAPSAGKAPKRTEGGVLGKPRGTVATVAMIVLSLVWLFPLLWAVFNSFRTYAYTQKNGYLSFGGWTLDNYANAWQRAEFGLHFKNSMIITIPAVVVTLLLASTMAFVLARFSYRFNLTLLGMFLAANLLPPQALLVPMFKIYQRVPLPAAMSDTELLLGSFWGLIAVNVAFQLGFCTFVLSNYMKTIPIEIYESAQIDGASVWRQYWQLTMPLVRPALAALGTLQFTWIYNEFFWATVLLGGRGEKFPITSSLNNLRGGQFFSDTNLVAAGSIVVALPVLIVFFVLQKQFVSGLTLGATKG
ncbi:MAG: carbohydrate ABC transporter permease [Nocardioides sp.]